LTETQEKGNRMLSKTDLQPALTCWSPDEAQGDGPGTESLKAALDFLLALVLLVPALPLMLLAAALVKFTSRGPVFYRQTRLGKGGRAFTLYKIRSMRADSEKHGACWSQRGDTRITPVGRFLRATHLDELPQLFNVLRGEMSLVGPRPERPEFIPALQRAIPRYLERLRVRPGVTGLAQVRLPADSDLESVRQKLQYDLYYVENCCLWLDLRVMFATALKMVGVPFPVLGRLFRLPQAGSPQPGADRQALAGQVFAGQLALGVPEQAA
jgi:lipopolysaccharide/colanic/teichoic acid biosynthesis glycosyltransferase